LEVAFSIPDIQAIYLLTDGDAYDDGAIVQNVKRWSNGGKIQCHTTSFFAPPEGEQLLKNIAAASQGTYLKYSDAL
jgi:hypothetical protein